VSPAKPKLADPGQLIRNGKARTDELRVCLDPDLVSEYKSAVLARDEAQEAARDSLAGGTAVELEAEIERLLQMMQAATITLVVKALPRAEFRAICDRHPQRKDADGKLTHPTRDYLGVDFDGFADEIIRASLISPVLDPETLAILLEERLTDGQYVELAVKAWNLNKETIDVPFSPAGSPKTRASSAR
jgi:hypothetical protein